jgi:hypothetical protein
MSLLSDLAKFVKENPMLAMVFGNMMPDLQWIFMMGAAMMAGVSVFAPYFITFMDDRGWHFTTTKTLEIRSTVRGTHMLGSGQAGTIMLADRDGSNGKRIDRVLQFVAGSKSANGSLRGSRIYAKKIWRNGKEAEGQKNSGRRQ